MKTSIKPHLASKILYDDRNQAEYEKDIFMDFMLRIEVQKFKLIQNNPPKPDIIVELYDSNNNLKNKIGCEITDIYWDKAIKGSPEKVKFERWKKYAKRLREDLDKLNYGFEYVYGVVSLRNFDCIEKSNSAEADNLTKEIITLLSSLNFPINTRLEFDISSEIGKYIEYIRFETYAERGILWWETSLLSGQIQYDYKIFEENILRKDEKHYDFVGCDEKWLLLYAESNNLGNSISFPMDFLDNPNIVINHKFDRVFYWDGFKESIYQIFPTYNKIFEVGKDDKNKLYINNLSEITSLS